METSSNFSIDQLGRRIWNVTWTGSFVQGRVSRGEYWLILLLLSLLNNLFITLISLPIKDSFLTPRAILVLLAQVFFGVFQIKFIIKRSHDLGKSGRFPYVPMFVLIGLGLVAVATFFYMVGGSFDQLTPESVVDMITSSWPLIILGVAMGVAMIWAIIRSFMLSFKKGIVGQNAYGEDPLLSQPSGNGLYRALALIFIGASTLLNLLPYNGPDVAEIPAINNVINQPASVNGRGDEEDLPIIYDEGDDNLMDEGTSNEGARVMSGSDLVGDNI